MARIVVVGGSLSALRVTEALRAQGWDEEIVVVGAEAHPPYTRPPLSKALLRSDSPDFAAVALRRRPEAERARWRLGVAAVGSDLAARTVALSDGSTVHYDGLVAATGVRARRLHPRVGAGGRVVRTFDDCLALRPALRPGATVVVVGAGFIGCEVASTAVALGCRVHVVALDAAPLQVPLGRRVGDAVRERHEARGVRFHLGTGVASITGTPTGTAGPGRRVTLDDGTALSCDVVVEAVGSQPSVEWLAGNGLDLRDGVACDNTLRMSPRAVAVGDVARFPNPLFDTVARRVEHWQMPGDTARRAATTLLAELTSRPADDTPFRPLPSFWSDQYDLRLQSFGLPALGERVEVLHGDLAGDAAVGYFRGATLVGVALLGMPTRAVALRRTLLAALTDAAPR